LFSEVQKIQKEELLPLKRLKKNLLMKRFLKCAKDSVKLASLGSFALLSMTVTSDLKKKHF
jgi:hypothetical protein